MTTATIPKVVEAFDAAIYKLMLVRNFLLDTLLANSDAEDGWRAGSVSMMGLIHFHRDADDADPRKLARAIGGKWKRKRDGSWESPLLGFTGWSVIIHRAEIINDEGEDVDLGESRDDE